MTKTGVRAGLMAAVMMALCGSVPAVAQDRPMEHRMMHRAMRHEMHRERHRMMRHEMRREMRREMRHREMRHMRRQGY